MKFIVPLLMIAMLAGCVSKTRVCTYAASDYPFTRNRTYVIEQRWPNELGDETSRLVRDEMITKGYASADKKPDFIVYLDVEDYITRKEIPAPASDYDPMGNSGTREYYGGVTAMNYNWKIKMNFTDSTTNKSFFRTSATIKAMEDDMGKYLNRMVGELMSEVPKQGETPKIASKEKDC